MRQYCSGGSTTWSSIQPLSGVCSSGWLRKKQNRPPGCEHPGDLGDRRVDLVDVLEHEAGDHGVERAVGERELVGRGPGEQRAATLDSRADLVPRRIDAGDQLDAVEPVASRLIWPSPHPTSSTRVAPASSAPASGRICSSYSGSAPAVNPSIHHWACSSHSSRAVRQRRRRLVLGSSGHVTDRAADVVATCAGTIYKAT